jgi:hypothetical protein
MTMVLSAHDDLDNHVALIQNAFKTYLKAYISTSNDEETYFKKGILI